MSPEALHREFGEEAVARERVAWKIFINHISYPTSLNLILAAGLPSDGWCIFMKYYVHRLPLTRLSSLNRRIAYG